MPVRHARPRLSLQFPARGCSPETAWCKAMVESAAVLGQLIITSTAILFLAKGKEAVPALVLPLEQVLEINLGS